MSPHEILAAGRLLARQKAPYFRSMLLAIACVETPGIDTIAVSAEAVMVWDPAFVARVTPAQMAGLWVHEVMHLVLRHAERRARTGRDPRKSNMAGDLAINPSILAMGLELPTGDDTGLFPEAFGFPSGLTADEYYALLEQAQPPKPGKGEQPQSGGAPQPAPRLRPQQAQQGDQPQPGDSGPTQPKGGPARGHCGSCAGHAHGAEAPAGDPRGRSPQEMARLDRAVAEAVQQAAQRSRGTVPANLARWAEEALRPARVPWQQKLARLTRNAVAWRAGAVDHRYDAPGRRQAGLGYGAGRPIMPRLRQPVPEVLMIVDTSGSMGPADLGDAMREARGVLQATGANLTMATCDTDVHGLQKVRRIEDALRMLRGGGGTDMRPAFEAAMRQRVRPEVIICATDGLVGDGVPTHAPPGVRVVWLLVGPHRRTPATWGEVVEVER